MKTFAIAAALPCLLAAGPLGAADAPPDPNVSEAQSIIKTFATSLQGELKAAVEQGGPTKAIRVCKDRAPAIAEDLSQKTGWQVGRVSLKTRNGALNAPDDWERAALLDFDQRKTAGEDVKTMSKAELVDAEGGKRFRFAKPIPTQELCLACHGTQVSEEVTAALAESYPDDQARGYSLGDIRGAFSLSKPQ